MFFNFLLIFSFIVFPKRVILHLEKVPDGIIHTGVSFDTPFKKRRYDFRIFNENNTCLTTGLVRSDPKVLFPNLYEKDSDANTRKIMEDFFLEMPEIIYRNICLGTTNKTFYEIENYSKKINEKYIFCIYDCRHYVDRFTNWAGVGHIPIWRLNQYYENNLE